MPGKEILDFTFDLPDGWAPIPLLLDDRDPREWAETVVRSVEASVPEPGERGDIVKDLLRLQKSLEARKNPWLAGSVWVRPESRLTIGCVLTGTPFALDPGEGPDTFEATMRDGFEHPRRGIRSLTFDIWREDLDAGELVGGYQRFDEPNRRGIATEVTQRTMFGVFPPDCAEMVTVEFTVADFNAMPDMRAETTAMVRTTRIELGVIEA